MQEKISAPYYTSIAAGDRVNKCEACEEKCGSGRKGLLLSPLSEKLDMLSRAAFLTPTFDKYEQNNL